MRMWWNSRYGLGGLEVAKQAYNVGQCTGNSLLTPPNQPNFDAVLPTYIGADTKPYAKEYYSSAEPICHYVQRIDKLLECALIHD
jgi:hypothetical protein